MFNNGTILTVRLRECTMSRRLTVGRVRREAMTDTELAAEGAEPGQKVTGIGYPGHIGLYVMSKKYGPIHGTYIRW